ncbi:MAG: CoA-binding protein [Bacteroidales bacterium]|nr:CoA-binding protein [Bacteroidales bacterium]
MEKVTVIIGASPNPDRYSYIATLLCIQYGIPIYPVGVRDGIIGNIPIVTCKTKFEKVHTVSLYISEEKQKEWYEYIFSLEPQRIIFNPGTYNPELEKLAYSKGIECVLNCMITMLHSGTY